jgi:hypothetical protein
MRNLSQEYHERKERQRMHGEEFYNLTNRRVDHSGMKLPYYLRGETCVRTIIEPEVVREIPAKRGGDE